MSEAAARRPRGRALADKAVRFGLRLLPSYLRLYVGERIPVVVPTGFAGTDLRMVCRSRTEFYGRRQEFRREPHTIEWLSTFRGGVFYDLGANVGTYSLIAAKTTPVERVFAFEPGYASFLSLCENVRINGLGKVVVPVQVAGSSRTGFIPFFYRGTAPGDSHHATGQPVDDTGRSFEPAFATQILGVTVDDFVERFGAPPPRYVKLDVDGAEMPILEGMRRTLAAGTIESLLVESLHDDVPRFEKHLASAGYHLDADFHARHSPRFTGAYVGLLFRRG